MCESRDAEGCYSSRLIAVNGDQAEEWLLLEEIAPPPLTVRPRSFSHFDAAPSNGAPLPTRSHRSPHAALAQHNHPARGDIRGQPPENTRSLSQRAVSAPCSAVALPAFSSLSLHEEYSPSRPTPYSPSPSAALHAHTNHPPSNLSPQLQPQQHRNAQPHRGGERISATLSREPSTVHRHPHPHVPANEQPAPRHILATHSTAGAASPPAASQHPASLSAAVHQPQQQPSPFASAPLSTSLSASSASSSASCSPLSATSPVGGRSSSQARSVFVLSSSSSSENLAGDLALSSSASGHLSLPSVPNSLLDGMRSTLDSVPYHLRHHPHHPHHQQHADDDASRRSLSSTAAGDLALSRASAASSSAQRRSLKAMCVSAADEVPHPLPGERSLLDMPTVWVEYAGQSHRGVLRLTSYRLMFSPRSPLQPAWLSSSCARPPPHEDGQPRNASLSSSSSPLTGATDKRSEQAASWFNATSLSRSGATSLSRSNTASSSARPSRAQHTDAPLSHLLRLGADSTTAHSARSSSMSMSTPDFSTLLGARRQSGDTSLIVRDADDYERSHGSASGVFDTASLRRKLAHEELECWDEPVHSPELAAASRSSSSSKKKFLDGDNLVIPLGCIAEVAVVEEQTANKLCKLRVVGKHFLTLVIEFEVHPQVKAFCDKLREAAFFSATFAENVPNAAEKSNGGKSADARQLREMQEAGLKKAFAFSSGEEFDTNGWRSISEKTDRRRAVACRTGKWRLSEANANFQLCSTYPPYVVVPASIADDLLKVVRTYRTSHRIPVLCYFHEPNAAVICRSSQPLVGLLGTARLREDEKLLQEIRRANPNSSAIHIFDCRSSMAAMANRAKGGGTENSEVYEQCELTYLNIPNIHTMRTSLVKLHTLCCSPRYWLSSLENTGWFSYISKLLEGADQVASVVNKGCSVLVHCSDGWDRTPQITALAQLLLDPYTRTIEGFQVLIESEWCEFSHKFNERLAVGIEGFWEGGENHECSPVFIQWIDCVWQLTRQFRQAFEFNERYLLRLLLHVYSARFGNFLCNSYRERLERNIANQTLSLWSYMAKPENLAEFYNPIYRPHKKLLRPDCSIRALRFWNRYYLRHYSPDITDGNLEDILLVDACNEWTLKYQLLADQQSKLERRNKRLEERKKRLQEENRKLKEILKGSQLTDPTAEADPEPSSTTWTPRRGRSHTVHPSGSPVTAQRRSESKPQRIASTKVESKPAHRSPGVESLLDQFTRPPSAEQVAAAVAVESVSAEESAVAAARSPPPPPGRRRPHHGRAPREELRDPYAATPASPSARAVPEPEHEASQDHQSEFSLDPEQDLFFSHPSLQSALQDASQQPSLPDLTFAGEQPPGTEQQHEQREHSRERSQPLHSPPGGETPFLVFHG